MTSLKEGDRKYSLCAEQVQQLVLAEQHKLCCEWHLVALNKRFWG